MANVTVLNGNSSTVGGAALFTASTNTRLLINYIKDSSSTITMRWGNSVNYNQVTSSDMKSIGRELSALYMSNDDCNFYFPFFGWIKAHRLTRGFHGASDIGGMTTTMAYPLELFLKSGEIFDLTCGAYSISVITE
jgi:hypothetical protein